MPGHSCSSKTGLSASGMMVIRRPRRARATSIAVVPPSRMTVSPSANRLARGGPYRRLGVTALEGPDAVRGFLGAEEDTRRPAVHTAQAPAALQGFEVTPDGHFRAIQCGGQLSDQHGTALAECLQDHLVANMHIHNVHSNINNVRYHTAVEQSPVETAAFDAVGVLFDWNAWERVTRDELSADAASGRRPEVQRDSTVDQPLRRGAVLLGAMPSCGRDQRSEGRARVRRTRCSWDAPGWREEASRAMSFPDGGRLHRHAAI